MTALDRYQRLEAPGVWREGPDAQRRDVIVSFGEATLTITTGADQAMAHWSLAAITRLNPGARPALFAPAPDDPEILEIADADMIEAIERVRRAVTRAGPHPHRLRMAGWFGLTAALLMAAFIWLPAAMKDYAASVTPAEKRTAIGAALLAEMQRLTGPPCSTALGQQALADLNTRLRPGRSGRIVVLQSGAIPSRHLPGGSILLNRAVVEDFESPDIAAGFVLAEEARLLAADPLREMLGALNLGASLKLLTTGNFAPDHLAAYAETVLAATPEPVSDDRLLALFADAQISAAGYAKAVDITGESVAGLIAADPVDPELARPVLDDGAWVSLQGICGG